MLVKFVSIFSTFYKLKVSVRYKYREDPFTITNPHFMSMFMSEFGAYFEDNLKRMSVFPTSIQHYKKSGCKRNSLIYCRLTVYNLQGRRSDDILTA